MKKRYVFCLFLILAGVFRIQAEQLVSPTWGFRLYLPSGYEFIDGDGKNAFSFESSFGTNLDLLVYTDKASVTALAEETEQKISNRGKKNVFTYNNRETIVMELDFLRGSDAITGWALFLELDNPSASETLSSSAGRENSKAYLLALAYGPPRAELQNLHISLLDSIEGSDADYRRPGAMTEFFHPQGEWITAELANSREIARFRENDAEAAQYVVDREFEVMKLYLDSPLWQEAWKRFYRMIYKDSFDRLVHAAFLLERGWNNSVLTDNGKKPEGTDQLGKRNDEAAGIAAKALKWVQDFRFERDLMGSDFVNLVTAVLEGRGDCDSRAMLWAVVLAQAYISSGIMVSREYSHAMGLADLEGQGARFPMKDDSGKDIRWMVAETTANVALGLIGETVSDISGWLGITFE